MNYWKFLTTRILAIQAELQDIRPEAESVWGGRVLDVNADEDEVFLRETSRVIVADIIADDAAARTRMGDPEELVGTKVPNLKLGWTLGQKDLNRLNAVMNSTGNFTNSERISLDRKIAEKAMLLRKGVTRRRNMIVAAAVYDDLSYDRAGIKFSSVNWGKPADLKVLLTSGRRWIGGNEATAKPITDIIELVRTAKQKYGMVYNRVTLSTDALLFMAKTDEFKNMASALFAGGFSAANVSALSDESLKSLAGRLLGLAVEVDDAQYREELASGLLQTQAYVPANRVILSNTSMDGNTAVMDFANAPVTEALVASLAGAASGIGGLQAGSEQRGPVLYFDGNHNPPQVNIWSVQRGFARVHQPDATAVLITS